MDIDISIKNATVEEIHQLMDKIFPKHRRLDDRATMIKNLDNLKADAWSPEEKLALAGSKNTKDAIKKYQAAFPLSMRTVHALRRMYQVVRKQGITKPAVVLQQPEPVQVKEPEVTIRNGHKEQPRTKLARAVEGKYQIPFSSIGAGKNEYQKALYLCKKYKVPYPEAIKLQAAEKSPISPMRSLQKDLAKVVTEDEPSTVLPHLQKPHFVIGDRVQCKEGHRELFTEVGIVKRINTNNGQLLVSFKNGMDWITANHVELAPPGAKV